MPLKGGSAEKARVQGEGCDAWYEVEPRGFVCAGASATIDANDPVVVALAKDAPKIDSPWPYEYGESIGAEKYERVPTIEEERHREWDFQKHADAIERIKAGADAKDVDKTMEGVDVSLSDVIAPELFEFNGLVHEESTRIASGSTVAWTREFRAYGRTFLYTPDKKLVPKDRVKPYPKSEFHGVELRGDVALPIAFFREKDRPKYRKDGDAFVATGETFARLDHVGLTGARALDAKKVAFVETREAGVWVKEDDAAIARARDAKTAPWLAHPHGTSSGGPGKRGLETWLDVSVLGGTLVAYEGDTPIFATMISPGRGGVPYAGKDPLETASTPTGTFRVDGKFVTATMVSSTNELFVHSDVNWVMNFHGPHALHGAYWHDRWGEPKSGGCVNLAPIDAKRIFEWAEPKLPEGWYGVRGVPEMGDSTIVDVHR